MKNRLPFPFLGPPVLTFLTIPLFILLASSSALAIQTHSAPEGVYVHQAAHLLYALAMLGFVVSIRKSQLIDQPGWQLISIGATLLACWNIWAFYGHIVESSVPAHHFLSNANGIKVTLLAGSWMDYLYFVLKMDHLLCVPALLFLYLGLKKINSSSKLFTRNQGWP